MTQHPDMTVTIVMETNWPVAAFSDEDKAKKFAKDKNEENRRALEAGTTQRKQFYFHQKLLVQS